MQTTYYAAAATTMTRGTTSGFAGWYDFGMGPVAQPRDRRHETVQIFERTISIQDVCELLDAAGALALRDIAGGLGVSTAGASTLVRRMVNFGYLREDEWSRYRLAGDCRG
jgi:hypothetical protein